MSYSITIPMFPRDEARTRVAELAESKQLPEAVASMITAQLDAMPEATEAMVSAWGHDWAAEQIGGEASCHFTITATQAPPS